MKKLFLSLFMVGALSAFSYAQADDHKAELTKEEKAKKKAQKEEDLANAIKETGLTKEQEEQVRETLKDAEQKGKDLKDNSSLTDEQKAQKKDEINSAKNDKLKEIMGEEKYKSWTAIRKKQKEKNAPAK